MIIVTLLKSFLLGWRLSKTSCLIEQASLSVIISDNGMTDFDVAQQKMVRDVFIPLK